MLDDQDLAHVGPVAVDVMLPLPLDIAGNIMRAMGALYPSSRVAGNVNGRMRFLIDDADRRDDDVEIPGPVRSGSEPEGDLVGFHHHNDEATVTVSLPETFGRTFAPMALQMLDDADAPNYLAIQMMSPEHGTFDVIVCRPGTVSPHDKRRAAEERAATLRGDLQQTLDRVTALTEIGDDDTLRRELHELCDGLRHHLDEMRRRDDR